jgi:hypothetical protein
MKKTYGLLAILLLTLNSFAADRYWVGGSGNWDNSPNLFATTSGGSPTLSGVTTSSDNVFFDSNSGGGTVTIGNTHDILNIDLTGFTGTFVTNSLNIFGNLTLGSGMALNGSNGTWTFKSTSGTKTITSNSIQMANPLIFDGAGSTWVLQDNLSTAYSINLVQGTFHANNFNVICNDFTSPYTNLRTVTMGSGIWTLTGEGNVWNTSLSSNLTLNANSSTIKLTNNSINAKTFSGGGLTYNNFWNATQGSGGTQIRNSNIFNDIKIDAGREQSFENGQTQIIMTLTSIGTSGSHIILEGASGIGALFKASGAVYVQYCDINAITVTGGATWCAGSTSIDNGNNTGWMFTNCTTVGINRQIDKNSHSVYPNPFSVSTTLQTYQPLKDATLTVYNSLGQIVKEINDVSGQTITLYRDNLQNGIYFIRFTQPDNKVISADKLIITD